MKTIIMTIKPNHLHDIRIGVKIFELRKRIPACWTPYRVLCCESGSGGKIVAEFTVDYTMKYSAKEIISYKGLLAKICLDARTLHEYLGIGYGHLMHISNMVDYCSTKGYKVLNVKDFGLERAPQSWCYVEEAHEDT